MRKILLALIAFFACCLPAIAGGPGYSGPLQGSGGGGGGTVTSVSSGNASPLFNVSVATPTATPAFSFSILSAAAHTFYGNNTGSTGTPAFFQPSFTDLGGSATAGQLPGTIVYNNQTNTWSTGVQDMSAATNFKVPVLASDPSSAAGSLWIIGSALKCWDNAGTPVKHFVCLTDQVSGDGTMGTGGALTVTKTNGATFATSATTNACNASNITSGNLPTAQLPTLTATDFWVGNVSNVATAVAMSGDATMSNAGAVTIAASAVTNAKMANMAAHTHKGNVSAGSAAPADLTQAQLTADLNQFTSTLQGVVSPSGGGTANFLRADNTWTAPTASLPSGAAYTVDGNNTSSTATTAPQVMVTEQIPQTLATPYGSNASYRACPTSGTATGHYVHYGNLTISGALTCNRCCIEVIGGNVTINSAITVATELAGGSTQTAIVANAPGQDGHGLGGGQGGPNPGSSPSAGGGGGFGGAGGAGGGYNTSVQGGNGGPAYNIENSVSGSGGGAGQLNTTAGGAGGAGGGGFQLYVSKDNGGNGGNVTFAANVTATGGTGAAEAAGQDAAGGGGSGGSIVVRADGTVTINSTIALSANGGAGGASTGGKGGGGGGGGIIDITCGGTYTNNGVALSATGGAAGTSGGGPGLAAVAGSAGITNGTGGATFPRRATP